MVLHHAQAPYFKSWGIVSLYHYFVFEYDFCPGYWLHANVSWKGQYGLVVDLGAGEGSSDVSGMRTRKLS
jgi:hypothetical protein